MTQDNKKTITLEDLQKEEPTTVTPLVEGGVKVDTKLRAGRLQKKLALKAFGSIKRL